MNAQAKARLGLQHLHLGHISLRAWGRLGPALGLSLLLSLSGAALAQRSSTPAPTGPRVYQLSGLVVGKNSGEPVPFTLVKVMGSRRLTTANDVGFYSLPVYASDTLVFQSIGYSSSRLIVGEYLSKYAGDTETPYIYEVHYLAEDSVVLPDVVLFPWRTPEELRTAMLNLPLLDNSPDAAARANLAPEALAAYAETLPVDAQERRAAAAQQYYMNYRLNSGLATVGIFDPFAVARMVGYMKRKSKAERDKALNAWPEDRPSSGNR